MRAKKLLTSHQIFRYAVPARTVTKKALLTAVNYIDISFMFRTLLVTANSVYLEYIESAEQSRMAEQNKISKRKKFTQSTALTLDGSRVNDP